MKSRKLYFLVIFAISGFAGLIYESIWSHYLKLFLGHAAYAQTLVLAIFMGGMALGSWICSKYSTRWSNLIRGYAIAEALIGVAALIFHPFYKSIVEFSYDVLLPSMQTPALVSAAKWMISGAMILPQSVLLGMTFPLMTAGLIRRYPERSGSTIATLYFGNSAGAALGVLASGFIFVSWVGLPGTLGIAGGINIALALLTWILARTRSTTDSPRSSIRGGEGSSNNSPLVLAFLGIAFVTGAASFIYEIAWIRMLSLVLGSSTHAFELMLSAFITGLAIGGFWIRRRIDNLTDPILFLAGVQVAMGLLALSTIPVYGKSFLVMRWMMNHLASTSSGYFWFNLGSHGISLAVMLPATICAGMTLPLITHLLLKRGLGESSIGAVYAWNTVGSIFGVFLATHIGLPALGLKGLIGLGAGLDILLGLALVWRFVPRLSVRTLLSAASIAFAALIMLGFELDAHKMISGVYRKGQLLDPEEHQIPFHRDGKTATISVTRSFGDLTSIRTNGKSDASVAMSLATPATLDEHTMIFAGVLALAIKPDLSSAANIGLGSGLTTHSLLASDSVHVVDTIEIESAMAEGARFFGDRVHRVFHDPRSKIHIEDAKAFFSTQDRRWDVIVSEPSNPWVSGVAGLFSQEFYQRIRRYLEPDGIFVQWLQIYELDLALSTSVLKALSEEFSDFEIYAPTRGDLLIIASPHSTVPALDTSIFEQEKMIELLERLSINNPQDIRLRWVANKKALEPFLSTQTVPANSDFYPILDQNAAKARFLNSSASEFFEAEVRRLPIMEMLGNRPASDGTPAAVTFNPSYERTYDVAIAKMMLNYHLGGPWRQTFSNVALPANLRRYADLARKAIGRCDEPISPSQWFDAMYNNFARRVLPFLGPDDLERLWSILESPRCAPILDPTQKAFVGLWKAVGNRDSRAMAESSRQILNLGHQLPPSLLHHVVSIGMLGHLHQREPTPAFELWTQYKDGMLQEDRSSLGSKILVAHSSARTH